MGFANKVLEKLVQNFGDLEIVKHGKSIYTFNKLNNRANQIARVILDLGVKKGDKYGILLYNSPEYLEIMFGLQKIEVIPVPINVRYGSTEFKYIYENADIKGVFIDNDFIEITYKVAKYTAENKNSMLQDILNGQPTEIDFINGRVLKYARELGIKVPINELLTNLVKGLESSIN